MTISDAVIKRLFDLCDERRLSINKLCTLSGVTQSTISDIVNRRTKAARIDTLKKLCDGLEISVRQFFDHPMFDDLEQEIR